MRYRNRRRQGGISGAIILIGLAMAFTFSNFGEGDLFLPILFVFLAFAMVVGSLGSLNPGRIYGTLIGAMWMIILAIFFIPGFHFWPIFLIGAALSALLGALRGPIMAALLGMGLFGMSSMMNNQQPQQPYYQPPQQPQQPYYQPTQQSQEPLYQPYQQGYQPPPPQPQPEVYQEGGQQHQYPQQYDQPQAQYPQQQPPMQG